jgi:hypothetical protein
VRPVKLWRYFLEFWEWLPIVAAPLVIYWMTDGFTKSLSLELWLIIGFALLLNLGWIGLMRSNRRTIDFLKKYPGFRMTK